MAVTGPCAEECKRWIGAGVGTSVGKKGVGARSTATYAL